MRGLDRGLVTGDRAVRWRRPEDGFEVQRKILDQLARSVSQRTPATMFVQPAKFFGRKLGQQLRVRSQVIWGMLGRHHPARKIKKLRMA